MQNLISGFPFKQKFKQMWTLQWCSGKIGLDQIQWHRIVILLFQNICNRIVIALFFYFKKFKKFVSFVQILYKCNHLSFFIDYASAILGNSVLFGSIVPFLHKFTEGPSTKVGHWKQLFSCARVFFQFQFSILFRYISCFSESIDSWCSF